MLSILKNIEKTKLFKNWLNIFLFIFIFNINFNRINSSIQKSKIEPIIEELKNLSNNNLGKIDGFINRIISDDLLDKLILSYDLKPDFVTRYLFSSFLCLNIEKYKKVVTATSDEQKLKELNIFLKDLANKVKNTNNDYVKKETQFWKKRNFWWALGLSTLFGFNLGSVIKGINLLKEEKQNDQKMAKNNIKKINELREFVNKKNDELEKIMRDDYTLNQFIELQIKQLLTRNEIENLKEEDNKKYSECDDFQELPEVVNQSSTNSNIHSFIEPVTTQAGQFPQTQNFTWHNHDVSEDFVSLQQV
ncbi:hypothetical protein GF322_05280 [Candidatus Dependentiae bacterium]|nr:hypothetical protein [Candidatus Dependentiae bacterium]